MSLNYSRDATIMHIFQHRCTCLCLEMTCLRSTWMRCVWSELVCFYSAMACFCSVSLGCVSGFMNWWSDELLGVDELVSWWVDETVCLFSGLVNWWEWGWMNWWLGELMNWSSFELMDWGARWTDACSARKYYVYVACWLKLLNAIPRSQIISAAVALPIW